MNNRTILSTVRNNLCISCGICKGICPKNSITYVRQCGMFFPEIDEQSCINCGLCADVCPGLVHEYLPKSTAVGTVTGEYLGCFNSWSLDPVLRHVSASGGFVSTVVKALLEFGEYDAVFTLDTYDYREQLKTGLYTVDEFGREWNQSSIPKSRYLPVSHEETVAYIKKHCKERLIIIGTSCAIRGILAVIDKLRLPREQYLLIGLFCDKVFNYNVVQYFNDRYSPNISIEKFHFKNKESGGWPGDMKFYPMDKEPFYVPLADRAKAKAYFMPERCLYCVDKLNVCADISVGDNYTGQDESEFGSNSVIIRTQKGEHAVELAKYTLELRKIDISMIQKAQVIDCRLDNLYFGDLRHNPAKLDLNHGLPREKNPDVYKKLMKENLQKLNAGAMYAENPLVLAMQIAKNDRKPNSIIQFGKRAVGFLRRRIFHR